MVLRVVVLGDPQRCRCRLPLMVLKVVVLGIVEASQWSWEKVVCLGVSAQVRVLVLRSEVGLQARRQQWPPSPLLLLGWRVVVVPVVGRVVWVLRARASVGVPQAAMVRSVVGREEGTGRGVASPWVWVLWL